MTPDPTPDDITPPDPRLPPESRAARSLTDRSRPEDVQTDAPEPHPLPERGPRIWPRIVGVLILLLGVGGAWLWQNPDILRHTFSRDSSDPDATRIAALETRIARLEQRPPADLAPLIQRLDALEKRVGQAAPAPADSRQFQARLDALESRAPAVGSGTSPAPVTDLQPLLARIDTLERAVSRQAAEPDQIDAIAARVAALNTQTENLASRVPPAGFEAHVDEMAHQLSGLSQGESKQSKVADDAERLARVEAADLNLARGHAIGPIPNAPPALARFATVAPPTEAALRLSFPAAARSALKVSGPDTEGKPFLDRVIARLQDFRLITVREGDHVLVGNSAAAILAHAQTLLDAGDLAGAAREVATLTGPPAQAMASWLADANALVAAREALAALAGNG